MCTGAIARSGLGRVVFALSGEQLQELKPAAAVSPDAAASPTKAARCAPR
jgi:tRNA(Arg) A34 adenosine deaminase TadA